MLKRWSGCTYLRIHIHSITLYVEKLNKLYIRMYLILFNTCCLCTYHSLNTIKLDSPSVSITVITNILQAEKEQLTAELKEMTEQEDKLRVSNNVHTSISYCVVLWDIFMDSILVTFINGEWRLLKDHKLLTLIFPHQKLCYMYIAIANAGYYVYLLPNLVS